MDSQLLSDRDVARMLGVAVSSVRRWRLLQRGPKYLKLGASVRYRPEDVQAWLDAQPTGGGKPEARR